MADEAFGVSCVGCLEHASALELNAAGTSEVDVGWDVEAQPGVAVLVVVLMWVIVSRPSGRIWVKRPARRVG